MIQVMTYNYIRVSIYMASTFLIGGGLPDKRYTDSDFGPILIDLCFKSRDFASFQKVGVQSDGPNCNKKIATKLKTDNA